MSLLKISVGRDAWTPAEKPWLMSCAYCGAHAWYFTWWGAQDAADTHAADPCDGIRLARLIGRLVTLRDEERLGDPFGYRLCRNAARTLDRLIAEATR